jgi:hypothetical protein
VIEHVEQTLSSLPSDAPARTQSLMRLDHLLARARRVHPDHDGLARRLYTLRLERTQNPRSALEIADARLTERAQDPEFWQLARRAALARFDEERLRVELARVYRLGPADAGRLAHELIQEVRRGVDYEHAEWALVTAHSLSTRARKLHKEQVGDVRLVLDQLPRLLAYWARLSRAHEAADLGVHILAYGSRGATPADAERWAVDTSVAGREATVIAASTWDDAQLFAQGRALAQRFLDGPLQLVVGIETIDAHGGRGKQGLVLAVNGRIEGAEFVLEQASEPLSRARWERLLRYLAVPLAQLRGNVFPPDELLIHAESTPELEAVIHAVQATGDVRCAAEGLSVRCRGGLGDARAATRALLRAARSVLGDDADAPWSGVE